MLLPRLCKSLGYLTLGPIMGLLSSGADQTSAETETVRLFVGLDLQVFTKGDQFLSIADIRNAQALLTDPALPAIPVREITRVKFKHATRISQHRVTLGDVNTERGYSVARDPRWEKRSMRSNLQTYRQDQLDNRQAALVNANTQDMSFSGGAPVGGGAEIPSPIVDLSAEATGIYTDYYTQSANLDDDTQFDTEAPLDSEEGEFDAINVEFTIACPTIVKDVYVAAIARIRDADFQIRDKIWFREIDQIGPSPRALKMSTAGLPPGFIIESVNLHVFRNGFELVTNDSEKQIPLSRAEAAKYLVLEHMGNHADETVSARPAWVLAPRELWSSAKPENFDYPVSVWVDSDGSYLGPAEKSDIPGTVKDLIESMYFLPALQDGEPIKGLARFNLTDFFDHQFDEG